MAANRFSVESTCQTKGHKPGKAVNLALGSALALSSAMVLSLSAGAVYSASPSTDSVNHKTRMSVSLGLLTLGKATFKYKIDGAKYTVEGNGKTSGLVDTFTSGYGQFTSTGIIQKNKISVRQHNASVKGKKKGVLKMSFDQRGVKSVYQKPDKRTKRMNAKKYVVVQPEHLLGVIDPASAIIISVDPDQMTNGRTVCNRRVPIYDGETRYDMQLSFKGTKQIKTEGYSGYAHVCNMRYIPISGHKHKQRNVEYMANNKNIDLWFAPMESSHYLGLIKVEVGTWIGNFVAEPEYFGKG